MDQALVTYFDERFRETALITQQVSKQIQDLRRESDRQFAEAKQTANHTLVLVEDIRHQLQLVAEGYSGLSGGPSSPLPAK